MKPITADKSNLGFVGIGYMGTPIARRLLSLRAQCFGTLREFECHSLMPAER